MLFKKKSYSSANKFKINNNPKEKLKKNIVSLFYAVLAALFIRSFFAEPFSIPSGSMYPNLKVGDYLFVSKYSYGFSKHSLPVSVPIIPDRIFYDEPQRGYIVVFKTPEDNRTDYIKRLIGLPGDKIEIVNNVISINGKEIKYDKISDIFWASGCCLIIKKDLFEKLNGFDEDFFIVGLPYRINKARNTKEPTQEKIRKENKRHDKQFRNAKTKKLEGGIFPDPRKGYQIKQFVKGTGGITRTFNPFLGPGKGLRSGPTPLGRQAPRLLKQGAKKLLKLALTKRL